MPRWGGMGLRRIAAWASLIVLSGCCAPKGVGRTRASDPTTRAPARPMVLEPSPVLQLVREERFAATGPLIRERDVAPRWQAPAREDAMAEAEPEQHYDEVVEADGIVRKVVVPRKRFATPEDLARAAIRDAESRRPRELYIDRLLLRTSGPICDCDGDLEERARVRAMMMAMIKRARPAIKLCLSQEMAEDPRIIVKAPALLVAVQARRLGHVTYRFAPRFEVSSGGVELRELEWQGEAGAELGECLAGAFESAYESDGAFLEGAHHVQLPLVAFVQPPFGMNVNSPYGLVALHASSLGWLHFERGEYEHALEFFADAWWMFHLVEYKYLEGMAYERLGDR
ncbi:MAG TPA: hypothetical protein VG755_42165, partial [Nannocystaceae bacterium]|nr:hypothetical protein [Nannocystaceae bacterium]